MVMNPMVQIVKNTLNKSKGLRLKKIPFPLHVSATLQSLALTGGGNLANSSDFEENFQS